MKRVIVCDAGHRTLREFPDDLELHKNFLGYKKYYYKDGVKKYITCPSCGNTGTILEKYDPVREKKFKELADKSERLETELANSIKSKQINCKHNFEPTSVETDSTYNVVGITMMCKKCGLVKYGNL